MPISDWSSDVCSSDLSSNSPVILSSIICHQVLQYTVYYLLKSDYALLCPVKRERSSEPEQSDKMAPRQSGFFGGAARERRTRAGRRHPRADRAGAAETSAQADRDERVSGRGFCRRAACRHADAGPPLAQARTGVPL